LVVIACGCVYGGLALRSHIDTVGATLTASASNSVLSTWVASRDEDVDVPAPDYYERMVGLLKEYYVEPIKNDEKLATGSVRGMIASLADPRSSFMDQKEFRACVDRQNGIYQGIGADFYLQLDGPKPKAKGTNRGLGVPPEDTEEAVARLAKVPRLVVAAVVPGGPAARAGVLPGDVVTWIDGRWVVEEGLLDRFNAARKLFEEGKITFSQISPLQKELRRKMQRALLPNRAMDRLVIGTDGQVTVTWKRNGVERVTTLSKAKSGMPAFGPEADGSLRLPVTQVASEKLSAAIAGKRTITIDLRNQPEGNFAAAVRCLQILAPNGTYGEFISDRHEPASALKISEGNQDPPKIVLRVDRTTRGPAEMLALALSGRNRAVLTGTEMGGDLSVLQTVELPDGTGYNLVTSEFRPEIGKQGLVAGLRRLP
jgi:carboxyl-terminal processing protease